MCPECKQKDKTIALLQKVVRRQAHDVVRLKLKIKALGSKR